MNRLAALPFGLALLGSGCGLLIGVDGFTDGGASTSSVTTTVSSSGTGGSGEVGGGGGTFARGGAGGAGNAVDWVRAIGGPAYDAVHAVTVDGSGNVIVVGEFGADVDLDEYPLAHFDQQDAFVAKYSPTGDLLWAIELFGEGVNMALDVVADPVTDYLYVVGSFHQSLDLLGTLLAAKTDGRSDGFAAAIAPQGALSWTKSFAGTLDNRAVAVALDPAGGLVIAGEYEGEVAVGGLAVAADDGAVDVFVAKLARDDGEAIWMVSLQGDDDDLVADVAVGPDQRVVVVGAFKENLSNGEAGLTAADEQDMFVASFSGSSGAPLALVGALGEYEQRGTAVAFAADGGYYVAGEIEGDAIVFGSHNLIVDEGGGVEAFVMRVDSSETPDMLMQLKGPGDQHVDAVVVVGDRMAVVGAFNQQLNSELGEFPAMGGLDGFALLTEADMDAVVLPVGGSADDRLVAAAFDAAGNVYFAGQFGTALLLADQRVPFEGVADGLVFKVSAP